MTDVLSVEGLSFQRAREMALFQDVTFSVGEGQICGIVGPSGIGKSTLLRLISGLGDDGEVPTQGRVRLLTDRDGQSPPEALRQGLIGVALQDPMLFP
jgi:ABC-type multidrug transport system ATPase subunit